MPALVDLRFDSLRDQGFTGSISDMLLQWLQANGATSPSLPDAWQEFLEGEGFPYGHRNDAWFELLGSLGYTGSLNDRETTFWEDGGVVTVGGVKITSQPVNWNGPIGTNSTFSVTATSGDASPLTYQWQEFTTGWNNLSDAGRISGATTSTLTISTTIYEDRNRQFRCIVTNAVNSRNSAAARLITDYVAPTVDAGASYISQNLAPATLSGSVTPGSDPSPPYVWSLYFGASGTDPGLTGTFSDPTSLTSTFTPDQYGRYVVELTATPGDGAAVSDFSQLTSELSPVVSPTVDAGGPYTANTNFPLTLAGSVTPGSDPAPTYLWTIGAGGTQGGTFGDATSLTSTFTPDNEGTYNLLLTATTTDAIPKQDIAFCTVTDILPIFSTQLQASLIPELATGPATPAFFRGSVGTVTDFEGLVRNTASNGSRFLGARRVQNGLVGSEDYLAEAAWSQDVSFRTLTLTGNTGPNGEAAVRIDYLTSTNTGLAAFSVTAFSTANPAGVRKRVSMYVRRLGGSTVPTLALSFATEVPLTGVTGEWKRFSVEGMGALTVDFAIIFGCEGAVVGVDSFEICGAQVEVTQGQANGAPGDYVSTGVLSAPFHGAGVDGVQYFTTKNGNTVSSNVVTEATGAAIGASDYFADASGPFGYVSESAKTNLALYSEQFTNASWDGDLVITANSTTAPSGTLTADTASNSAITSEFITTFSATPALGAVTVTFSLYAKKDTLDWVMLGAFASSGSADTYFNLNTGTIGFSSPDIIASSITPVGNGWYRCSITAGLINIVSQVRISVSPTGTPGSYLGNGSGLYIWGAQLEQASFPSSYIPTVAATVARAADTLIYADTGNIVDAKGTAFAELGTFWTTVPTGAEYTAIARTYAGRILDRPSSSGALGISSDIGGSSSSVNGAISMNNAIVGMASTWGAELIAYAGGTPDPTPATYNGDLGTSVIGVGARGNGSNEWNGTLRNVQIFDQESNAAQVGTLPKDLP